MKYFIALFSLIGMVSFVSAQPQEYLCSVSGPDSTYSIRFKTKEECNKLCPAGGVCEETAVVETSE